MRPRPPSAMRSFFTFLLGFATFITLSFTLTIAVSNYSQSQAREQHAAAALARVFEGQK